MKKIVILLFVSLILIVFYIPASAADDDFKEEISDKLFSSMESEILDSLKDFGIESLDYENIYEISFENVASYFKDNVSDKLSGSLKTFMKLLSVVMIVGAVTMIMTDDKSRNLLFFISVAVVTLLIVDNLNLCLNSTVSMLKVSNSFMLSFVPVYALIITVSGNPAAALTYNSLVLAIGEGISLMLNYGIVDLLGAFFCLGITFSLSDSVNFGKLISVTNKVTAFLLGLVSSLFAAVLSIKSVLSASADTVASKGIRFAISSLIPVVGSSISEAYSSLLGSINIIKGSVAIVGIVAVLMINLPIIAENLMFYVSMSTLGFISELLGCDRLSDAFKAFACGIRILLLITVFEMFVLIISTGIMLSFKGG